jgi:hypothetical protein
VGTDVSKGVEGGALAGLHSRMSRLYGILAEVVYVFVAKQ